MHPTLLCSKDSWLPQSFSQRQEKMAQSITAGEPQTNLQTNCAVPVPPLPSMIKG